jgi:predicted MPP superfamily phosphohydrolase
MDLISLLLWLGACVGHTALMVFWLNWLYGCHLPQKLLKAARKIAALLILAGPAFWWFTLGLPTEQVRLSWNGSGAALVSAYAILCWSAGFVVAPLTTLRFRLRRRARPLLSNHTAIVDVAAELGYQPIGTGKLRHLARLPGNEVFTVDFSVRAMHLPQIPTAWDGLSILHLSDLHLCGTPDRAFYQHIMDRCRDWDPDLVAITGDVVDSNKHHRWVLPVLTRLRWRIAAFAILGNHDSWRDEHLIRRRLRRCGMRVLGNGWEQLEVRGEPLVVIGNEYPWFGPAPGLSGCPESPFRLCLSHTPDNIAWARRHHIDLVLAGHVHGGQIRLPLVGSVFVPSRYGRRFDCGTFALAPTLMHVSRGLAGQQPVRYNCRPEATKIVLRKSPDAAANDSMIQ